ncbi:MAG: phage portal protein family protein [Phocaeicola sp.]
MSSKKYRKELRLAKQSAHINYSTTSPLAQTTTMQRDRVIQITQQTEALTKKDLGMWRQAWQAAIEVDNPCRRFLYDIYSDVDADLHLTGCIGQRSGFVKRKGFRLMNTATKQEDTEKTEILESEWFKELMNYALESRYWGHSLIELGQPTVNSDGKMAYSYVRIVPRKHVVPEYGVILKQETDLWNSGFDYRNSELKNWSIEVGGTNNLGLYLKTAHQVLPKKNMLAFWDQFGEIFGMPIRIGKTISSDKKVHNQLEGMLARMGTAPWALFPEGTEIEIKESSRGDTFNIYDKRIDRANSEISKGVLLQTMTIDNGASLSQGQVHFDIFKNVIDEDADMIRDMVNNKLLPLMVRHGFPMQGLRFEWDDSVDYTPEQRVTYEKMVLEHYEVDPSYFVETYNIPVLEKKKTQQLVKPFFD